MRRLPVILIAILCVGTLYARTSLTVTAPTAIATVPASGVFTSIGLSNHPSRWELRIHSYGSPANGSNIIGLPTMLLTTSGSNINFNLSPNPTANDTFNSVNLVCCTAGKDYLIRVQRDTANSQYTFEVCATDTNACTSGTSPITLYGTQTNWGASTARTLFINPDFSIAFLRWYSTTVTIGTKIPVVGTTGDVADWEFQSSLVDSVAGVTFSGGTSNYSTTTPIYAPVCNAGVGTTFAAGRTGALDGTGSYPLDNGTTLTYAWSQTVGPSVTWTSATTASQPTFTGISAFGPLNFALSVTDGNSQTTSCAVHDGAVVADSNNIVIIQNNPIAADLIGPQMMYGRNDWPWFDTSASYTAGLQIANINSNVYYTATAQFDTPGPGTITVTNGSAVVTGSSTTLQNTICGGPGNTVPTTNVELAVWWPDGTSEGGRRLHVVNTCDSQTQLTLREAWSTVTAGAGLQYSAYVVGQNNNTQGPAQEINYYDNAFGLYALYYRSGIDTYRDGARAVADTFWRHPKIDRGWECGAPTYGSAVATGHQYCMIPAFHESLSLAGLILRAADSPPHDMWPGLRLIVNAEAYSMDTAQPSFLLPGSSGIGDVRNEAFILTSLNYCALYDADAAYRASCRASIAGAINGYFGTHIMPDGGWESWSSTADSKGTGVTANLANGSSAVTVSASANFTSAAVCGAIGTVCPVWFWHAPISATVWPATNTSTGADTAWYLGKVVSNTQLTLVDGGGNPVTYTGATCAACGWAIANSVQDSHVGYGTNVFMESHLGAAFDGSAHALSAYDSVTAAKARLFAVQAAQWIKTQTYIPGAGLAYGGGFVNCPAPQSLGSFAGCLIAGGLPTSRTLIGQSWRGIQQWYASTKDPIVGAWLDALFNMLFAKPGTCPLGSTVCTDDANYASGIDPLGSGEYLSDPAISNGMDPKWFGSYFGYGNTGSWSALRKLILRGTTVNGLFNGTVIH